MLELFLKVLLPCRKRPASHRPRGRKLRRQFLLTNHLFFARNIGVMFAGVCSPEAFVSLPYFPSLNKQA